MIKYFLAFLSLLPFAGIGAQQSLRYRYETANIRFNNTEGGPDAFALLSLTSRDSAGGVLWRVVIDSMTAESDRQNARMREKGLPTDPIAPRKGMSFEVFVKNGVQTPRVVAPASKDMDILVLTEQIKAIFEDRASLRVGEVKVDSTLSDSTWVGEAIEVIDRTREVVKHIGISRDTVDRITHTQSHSQRGALGGTAVAVVDIVDRRVYGMDGKLASQIMTTTAQNVSAMPAGGTHTGKNIGTITLTRIP